MGKLLKGAEVSSSLLETVAEKTEALKKKGTVPTLAILRAGEKPEDMAYERGALKRAEETGIKVVRAVLEENVPEEKLLDKLRELNEDEHIHGILVFRPLPAHVDDAKVCRTIDPRKDVDGISAGSMAAVFTGNGDGFPPCTAKACVEILDHYGIELEGKKVTVAGRSLVIGRPVAMMVLEKNATLTICHSRTKDEDFKNALKNADVIIAAVGKAGIIKAEDIGEGQTIIDVGINTDENGDLCGDVDAEGILERAAAVTPVPGGVGRITAAVLMKHVVQAAERQSRI